MIISPCPSYYIHFACKVLLLINYFTGVILYERVLVMKSNLENKLAFQFEQVNFNFTRVLFVSLCTPDPGAGRHAQQFISYSIV